MKQGHFYSGKDIDGFLASGTVPVEARGPVRVLSPIIFLQETEEEKGEVGGREKIEIA